MQKKNSDKPIYSIVAICFIIAALLFSVHFWAFNESFYRFEHSKLRLYGNTIADHIGISEEDLDKLTHFTLSYLNDPNASLDIQMNVKGQDREIFTDEEKLHMIDVRNLNLTANTLLIMTSIISLIAVVYAVFKKELSFLFKAYKKVLLAAGMVLLVLGVWILIDFDSFWTMFHHVFFPTNELWILDLRKDILIMIVPPEFFNHLVITIVVTFIAILALAYFALRFVTKKGIL